MPTELYLDYESSSTEIRSPDPNDKWDAGDSTGDYWVTGVTLEKGWRDFFVSEEDISVGDTVHVVYIAYDSGSTFGTDGGYGEIVIVTKDEWKAALVEEYLEARVRGEYSYPKTKNVVTWPKDAGKEPVYLSGFGYFDHNQRVRNATFVVK